MSKPVNSLRAGAAMVDITPAMGIQIAGDIGRYRPVEEIREPLYARALVLESGGRKVCVLSMDILWITNLWADEIRNQAAVRFGFDPQAVMVHIVQNHAAPGMGHAFVLERDEFNVFPKEYPWLLGGDDRYNPRALEGTLKAIGQALAALQPVQVKVGRGVDGRVAFNRRFVMRDGTAQTHPGNCNPNVLNCEGPIDPEVGVMLFMAENGKTVAAILHHTCHPTHGYPQRWVSSGWPGAWCDGVQRLCGPDCVPLLVNGFCGNIHHCNHLDPHYTDDYKEMGRKLTETAGQVMQSLQTLENPVLDWQTRRLAIPMRCPTDEQLAIDRQLLKDHPAPIWKPGEEKIAVEWEWVYAATRIDVAGHYRRNPNFDYFMQAFRVGNTAILAVPGEPFVEEQLRIKLESPAPYTWMAHMSNGYVGYVPTLRAFQRGGYETRPGAGSKLAPEALTMIGDASLELLKSLFAK
jgi:neutral ceramidase